MNCLLPIDWLDLLEQGDDAVMEEHLASCLSCQAIVETLRRDPSEGALTDGWTSGLGLASAPKWDPSEPKEIRFGQIWLTRDSFKFDEVSYANLDRVIVLVLNDPVEEHNWPWVHVAPLLTDTDSATSTDLLMAAEQTRLNVPLSAYLRYEGVLMTNQLDACIGELTDPGREMLQAVQAGDFDAARFGAALESAFDARLEQTESLRAAMDQLTTVYASVQESSAEASVSQERSFESGVAGALEAFKSRIAHVYQLMPEKWPIAQSGFAAARLAAASKTEEVNPFLRHFALRESGVELAGTLELKQHETGAADLIFLFQSVRGLPKDALVVICVFPQKGEPIASPVVHPEQESQVVVASDAPVMPIEVDTVEVRLGT